MVLSGYSIKQFGLVRPCLSRREKTRGGRRFSWGLSSASYDTRIEFDGAGKVGRRTLQPGETLLASTIEELRLPPDICAFVLGKSTWARTFLLNMTTFVDPGFRGFLTLELANISPVPQTIHRGDPVCQLVFMRTDLKCEPYNGKYQNQERGPQAAR